MFIRTGLAALAIAASFATTALADDGQAACRADAKVVCPLEYAAHDRNAAKACLLKNITKTSPACHAYIDKQKAAQGK